MILRFALVDDSLSYTRVMLHEMHHPAENIEMLFVGSSHCYRSIVPELTDSGFDAYTFNAGSSSQPMDGSLALVREAAGKNRLQRVFLEVYYGVAPTAAYRSRSQLTGIWILSDYLRPGLNRVSFLLRASGSKYYMMGFLPVRREWKRLFRPAEIVQTLRNKSTAEYRDYGPPPADRYEDDGTERYLERGFVANTGVQESFGGWNDQWCDPIAPEKIHEDHWDSLRSILRFCRRKGIRVSLFLAPIPDATIAGKSDYEGYKEKLLSEIAGYDADLTDFNLMREDRFDGNDPALFCDWNHLNENGARQFSEILSEYYTGRIPETELFYGDLEEKLAAQPERLYGAFIDRSSDEECRCRVACNRMSGCGTFRVTWTADDGEQIVLLDHGDPDSAEGYFTLPRGEKGNVDIFWRTGIGELTANLRYNDKD
ncbi:MAG: hypothetical protein IK096_03010 [Lachnospiraceae bacterium]|nr:hypothetical protein [Lachnospiraceae bacterium]